MEIEALWIARIMAMAPTVVDVIAAENNNYLLDRSSRRTLTPTELFSCGGPSISITKMDELKTDQTMIISLRAMHLSSLTVVFDIILHS